MKITIKREEFFHVEPGPDSKPRRSTRMVDDDAVRQHIAAALRRSFEAQIDVLVKRAGAELLSSPTLSVTATIAIE